MKISEIKVNRKCFVSEVEVNQKTKKEGFELETVIKVEKMQRQGQTSIKTDWEKQIACFLDEIGGLQGAYLWRFVIE